MRTIVPAAAILLGLGAARAEEVGPAVLRDLAPTGTLQAAINLGNPVLAQAGADGPEGVSVDLARELGRRLGVPVALVTYEGAGAVSAAAGDWDICFLAVDPARAEAIAFTAPYLTIAGSYLVRGDSAIAEIEAVDREGVRIAVGRDSAYDLYLSRALRHATLVRAPTSAAAVTLFRDEKLDVAAGIHQPLLAYAAIHPEVRLLPGHFMAIRQAMGLPKGRPAGAAYLARFVETVKGGFVAEALRAHGEDPALAAAP